MKEPAENTATASFTSLGGSRSPGASSPGASGQRLRRPHLSVVLLDDVAAGRDELREALQRQRAVTIVGEAGSGADALRLLGATAAEVVVMDVLLRRESGLDVIRHIRREHPDVRIVVATNQMDESLLLAALRAGAHAYVDRASGPARLADALQLVARGERVLPDQRAVTHVVRELERLAQADVLLRIGLSPEERRLLALVAEGHNNQNIAERLQISLATVKRHLTALFGKLQASDRHGAISEAMRQGVL